MSNMSILDEIRKTVDGDPVLKEQAALEKQRYDMSNLLRTIRLDKNYSQKDIAIKTGLTQQMISKIETYNGTPSLESFLKYCNGIGINILELIQSQYENSAY